MITGAWMHQHLAQSTVASEIWRYTDECFQWRNTKQFFHFIHTNLTTWLWSLCLFTINSRLHRRQLKLAETILLIGAVCVIHSNVYSFVKNEEMAIAKRENVKKIARRFIMSGMLAKRINVNKCNWCRCSIIGSLQCCDHCSCWILL